MQQNIPTCEQTPDISNFKVDAGDVSQVAKVKQFLEIWSGDEVFRELLKTDPEKALQLYELKDIDADAMKILWDYDTAVKYPPGSKDIPDAVVKYRKFVQNKLAHRDYLQKNGCCPSDANFNAWRKRQLNRCWFELGTRNASIVHAPLVIELTKGCSVGCWFCGISSQKFEGAFAYSAENAELWRQSLNIFREIIGPAAGSGVCYWATEPLDNPDYEKFCVDFHEILGSFPQTTTAIALKNVERTKNLIKLAMEKNSFINRFSILNLASFRNVYKQFTPEELLYVEIINQNSESMVLKSNSGRARQSKNKEINDTASTIACISGFLINMVEKSVKLISPCISSDEWPKGYYIFDSGTFTDAQSLEELLRAIISRSMWPTVRHFNLMRLVNGLNYEDSDDGGFRVFNQNFSIKYNSALPWIGQIKEYIKRGDTTAGDIAMQIYEKHGAPPEEVFITMNYIFKCGVIDEDPNLNKNK